MTPNLKGLAILPQAAAAGVPQEETTVPGEWPGIYACDRRKLLSVYNGTLRAALAMLHGDVATAEVGVRVWPLS